MKINGEEVELVADFASLRAGMIVVVSPCAVPWCLGSHRHMLTRLSADAYYVGHGANGVPCTIPAWDVLPGRSCRPTEEAVISRDTIARRIVYRVVDPLLDAKPVTRTKELAR
jgi:hypothetical protein